MKIKARSLTCKLGNQNFKMIHSKRLQASYAQTYAFSDEREISTFEHGEPSGPILGKLRVAKPLCTEKHGATRNKNPDQQKNFTSMLIPEELLYSSRYLM